MREDREFKYIKNQDELEEAIIFLAEDLKRRAKEISNDWDESICRIDIESIIEPGNLLKWDITKEYIAYKRDDV